jgi:hypothetical protein
MKTIKGMPITGTNVSMSKKRPFVPDAKDTSGNEQTMIAEPPAPFKNNLSTPQMPTRVGTDGPRTGIQHTSPGLKALPSGGPVGQRKPINQSGQVNGRMGTSFPRKVGQNGQGFPSKRNARFYGE